MAPNRTGAGLVNGSSGRSQCVPDALVVDLLSKPVPELKKPSWRDSSASWRASWRGPQKSLVRSAGGYSVYDSRDDMVFMTAVVR